ncbi:hypothetical protein [Bradyrhizobium yuanmingense]|uniref:hypothetical protein n=1 Tax=Bradyrhizobium yuanmingense TaxID=108015 RepID=UPI0023B93672|nr:hypothetical protein [Bradyrhizobium yuanmingense]MDF0578897.1 hypothetical protein [Bradyrhizobium yuanmingense]
MRHVYVALGHPARLLRRIGFDFASNDSLIEDGVQAKRPKVKIGANVYINSCFLIDGHGTD